MEESPERDRSISLQAEGEMELRCYKIFLSYSCKLFPLLVECKYVVGQLRKDVSMEQRLAFSLLMETTQPFSTHHVLSKFMVYTIL